MLCPHRAPDAEARPLHDEGQRTPACGQRFGMDMKRDGDRERFLCPRSGVASRAGTRRTLSVPITSVPVNWLVNLII